MEKNEKSSDSNGFDDVVTMIGGKWKLWILRILIFGGTRRFNELRREIKGITQTMLTNQLRALESDGLVVRKAYAEVPPRVEYTATPMAKELHTVFSAMYQWANRNVASHHASTSGVEKSTKGRGRTKAT